MITNMITKHDLYNDLAQAIGIKSLYFKREDLHPYGSHKGRSIPRMIDEYLKENINHFAISSSGNAALASAYYIKELNENRENKIKLEILIGRHIATNKQRKLEEFKDENISITMHDRPLQTLFTITKDPAIRALRQSNDDLALIGYESLAEELLTIHQLEAVFVGTSSGTTAQALAQYFIKNNHKVEIHIVQTSTCNPIAKEFVDNNVIEIEENSIADAIVDHTALRKDNLIKLIKETNGNGWIVTNNQIKIAQELTRNHTDITISTNSALSIAGLIEAVYTGKKWNGSVACIICGD